MYYYNTLSYHVTQLKNAFLHVINLNHFHLYNLKLDDLLVFADGQ